MDVFETLKILIRADSSGLQRDIQSATSFIGDGLSKALKDVKTGKIDMSKLFNQNFYSNLNWTSIISKLFSPANLLAFFSAMAAVGVVTAATEQAAVGSSPSTGNLPGGATGTASQAIIDAAQTIADQTGQSSTDIITTIEELLPALGNNVTAAEQLADQVAMAANASGTSASSVASQFAPLLQSLGITDVSDATTLLTSFANAAAQSNTPVQTLIQDWQQFAPLVAQANIGQTGLNNAVQQFGASVEGSGIQAATSVYSALFQALTPSNATQEALSAAAGGIGTLKTEIEDGTTSKALSALGTAFASLPADQINLVAAAFGLNSTDMNALEKTIDEYPIDTQKSIQQLFQASITPMTQFNQALQTFENLASNTFGGPLLTVLTGITNFFTNLIQNQTAFALFVAGVGTLAGISLVQFAASLAAIATAAKAIAAAGGLGALAGAGGVAGAAGTGEEAEGALTSLAGSADAGIATSAAAGVSGIAGESLLGVLLAPVAAGTLAAVLIGAAAMTGTGQTSAPYGTTQPFANSNLNPTFNINMPLSLQLSNGSTGSTNLSFTVSGMGNTSGSNTTTPKAITNVKH
jgi:hypothetical protein